MDNVRSCWDLAFRRHPYQRAIDTFFEKQDVKRIQDRSLEPNARPQAVSYITLSAQSRVRYFP